MCSLAGINNVRSLYLRITPPSARETPSASGRLSALALPSVCTGGRTRAGQEGTLLPGRDGRGEENAFYGAVWRDCRPRGYDVCQRGYWRHERDQRTTGTRGRGVDAPFWEECVWRKAVQGAASCAGGRRFIGPQRCDCGVPVFPPAGAACPCGNLPTGLHGSPAKGYGGGMVWTGAFFSGGNTGRQSPVRGQGHVPSVTPLRSAPTSPLQKEDEGNTQKKQRLFRSV